MVASAKESKKVSKVRKKLKKMMAEEKKCYTDDALREMSKTIHQWISRHQSERINIKNKSFRLFNENEEPAEVKSHFVQELFQTISHEKHTSAGESYGLRGRVQEASEEET